MSDEQQGLARLEQFSEQGLARIPENAEKVDGWILTNRNGRWSQKNVDDAVLALRNELVWGTDGVQAAPAPPSETLLALPDGTRQLPLNHKPDKHASLAQLKDWLARTRGVSGKYLRPRGSWGTSL